VAALRPCADASPLLRRRCSPSSARSARTHALPLFNESPTTSQTCRDSVLALQAPFPVNECTSSPSPAFITHVPLPSPTSRTFPAHIHIRSAGSVILQIALRLRRSQDHTAHLQVLPHLREYADAHFILVTCGSTNMYTIIYSQNHYPFNLLSMFCVPLGVLRITQSSLPVLRAKADNLHSHKVPVPTITLYK
jgi:hypothetical protein